MVDTTKPLLAQIVFMFEKRFSKKEHYSHEQCELLKQGEQKERKNKRKQERMKESKKARKKNKWV